MLQQLISKIDKVISLAGKDDIPTTNVSALLELLSKAYKYGHSVSQEGFTLCEASVKALDNCDAAFKRFLSRRMIGEEEQAEEELESYELFAGGFSTDRLLVVSLCALFLINQFSLCLLLYVSRGSSEGG